ncbi:MAG: hypothetical protein GY951_08905, partial [Psychromonas sp.]|nr:hypothetical protein [Psychromonas sp.]
IDGSWGDTATPEHNKLTIEQKAQLKNTIKSLSQEQRKQIRNAVKTRTQARS